MNVSSNPLTVKLRSLGEVSSEAKVGDLHIQTVVEENILGLQISMNDVARVNVVDAFENLSHDVASLLL